MALPVRTFSSRAKVSHVHTATNLTTVDAGTAEEITVNVADAEVGDVATVSHNHETIPFFASARCIAGSVVVRIWNASAGQLDFTGASPDLFISVYHRN